MWHPTEGGVKLDQSNFLGSSKTDLTIKQHDSTIQRFLNSSVHQFNTTV